MKVIRSTTSQLLLVLIATIQLQSAMAAPSSSEPTHNVLHEPLVEFSSKIFDSARSDQKNMIMSPLSIHSALNLVLLGATPGSNTEKEIESVLGYTSTNTSVEKAHNSYASLIREFKKVSEDAAKLNKPKKDAYRDTPPRLPSLDIWNMIVSKGIEAKPQYIERIQQYYNCSLEVNTGDKKKNDALVSRVNKWAREAGFDQDVLKSDDLECEAESINIMNAVRVQAYWFDEFHEYEDENVFYNFGLASKVVKKGMALSKSDLKGRYMEFKKTESKSKYEERMGSDDLKIFNKLAEFNFRVVQIPLVGGIDLTIFEPLANGTGKELADLEINLLKRFPSKDPGLAEALKMIDLDFTYVEYDHFQMPRFKFQEELKLNSHLKSMGMKQAFDQNHAEIREMATKDCFVDSVVHKALVEVNKSGLKAAGFTIVRMVPLMGYIRNEPLRVKIQHPFMFMVRYNKLPMFIGHLVHL